MTLANLVENEDEITSREVLKNTVELEDDFPKDAQPADVDWMDLFTTPDGQMYPSPSAALMAHATKSDKSAEDQLKEIKEIASKITCAIQSEMANLLAYALENCEKSGQNNTMRKRRSAETPMASTELVMRLLKHIKSNNEYQNIAIEKMMSAQEIADKFGIEFTPDTEILSDLAVAANEQTKELSSILEEACETKNVTQEEVSFVPMEECEKPIENASENSTYYVYSVHPQSHHDHDNFAHPHPSHQHVHNVQPAHNHYSSPYETQIPPPPVQPPAQPVTPRPTYYDSMMPFSDPFTFCPLEPVTTTTTIMLPIEEFVEPEPELVGEEYEETVSSKVFVSHDEEPGSSTVSHVMTYTLSEKAHFKTPEIESLPQQMQYSFFLI